MNTTTIHEIMALDALKDLRRKSTYTYRKTLETIFKALDCPYSLVCETEAMGITIALIYHCFGKGNELANRALVSLGLMQGFSRIFSITERREMYGELINASSEVIRKSEDDIFHTIVTAIHEDAKQYGGIEFFIEKLKKDAIKYDILQIEDDVILGINNPRLDINICIK